MNWEREAKKLARALRRIRLNNGPGEEDYETANEAIVAFVHSQKRHQKRIASEAAPHPPVGEKAAADGQTFSDMQEHQS